MCVGQGCSLFAEHIVTDVAGQVWARVAADASGCPTCNYVNRAGMIAAAGVGGGKVLLLLLQAVMA
jgi:hypothetical protein